MKCLCIDKGIEFLNSEIDNLCGQSGILDIGLHLTLSSKNGIAEMMNCTLPDKVRCVMLSFGMPMSF